MTGNIDLGDGVGDGETLVDWGCLGNTIARVDDNTSGTAGGVER